jgi:DNA-binding transcriptional LysR family regulator
MYRAPLQWDDARLFLAVARAGSLRAAGRRLGLSQPTVGRRLARFEAAAHAARLFDRLPDGVRLTEAGRALIPLAERVEAAALALQRRKVAQSDTPATVRISVGEWAGGFLAHCLGDPKTRQTLPGNITIELVVADESANLTRRAADLAVRHGRPEQGDLYVARVGTIACAVYRSRRARKSANTWIAYTEEQARYAVSHWLSQHLHASGGMVGIRASSLAMQIAAARSGAGSLVLPCYLGDADGSLTRTHDRIDQLDAIHWLIVHRDLRHVPQIRTVMDWIKQVFAAHRPMLEGDAGH